MYHCNKIHKNIEGLIVDNVLIKVYVSVVVPIFLLYKRILQFFYPVETIGNVHIVI